MRVSCARRRVHAVGVRRGSSRVVECVVLRRRRRMNTTYDGQRGSRDLKKKKEPPQITHQLTLHTRGLVGTGRVGPSKLVVEGQRKREEHCRTETLREAERGLSGWTYHLAYYPRVPGYLALGRSPGLGTLNVATPSMLYSPVPPVIQDQGQLSLGTETRCQPGEPCPRPLFLPSFDRYQ